MKNVQLLPVLYDVGPLDDYLDVRRFDGEGDLLLGEGTAVVLDPQEERVGPGPYDLAEGGLVADHVVPLEPSEFQPAGVLRIQIVALAGIEEDG